MRRLLTWLALALAAAIPSLGQNPNSAAYPNTVVTEQQATIQSNEVVTGQMALNGGVNSSALTLTLVDASNLIVPSTIQIDNEIILIASKAGNDLTVFNSSLTATGCTNASPIVVTTSAAHALTGRERVTIGGVTGNTACNVTRNSITVLSTTTFSLTGTTGNGVYTSGGAITAVGRGFDGSTPASHVTGALVEPNIVAHHINQMLAELRAIETALGPNLSNALDAIDCASPSTLTLDASGAVTVPNDACYLVDTFGAAGTDDMTAINCTQGQRFIFLAADDARTVVVKKVAGIESQADFSLDSIYDAVSFVCLATNTAVELSRSNGGS